MSYAAKPGGTRRIHIIGGPGSGKTTMARELGSRLGLPIYHLDEVAFEGPDFTKRPLAARLADVGAIAARPDWITEGMFLGWTDALLSAADTIVWLDCVSWYSSSQRIVARFVRLGWEGFTARPGLRKFTRYRDYVRRMRQLVELLDSSRRYYRPKVVKDCVSEPIETRVATVQRLAPYVDKVVHCRTLRDTQLFLANMVDMTGDNPNAWQC